MTTSELRQRVALNPVPDSKTTNEPYPPKKNDALSHPSGRIKYGRVMAFLRALSVGIYFLTGCIVYVRFTQRPTGSISYREGGQEMNRKLQDTQNNRAQS